MAVSRWSIRLSSKLYLCNSFHGPFAPNSNKGQSVYTLVFVLEFHVFSKLYQLVLDQSIKMLASNSWAEEAELPVFHRQASKHRKGKKIHHALEGERATRHVI